MKQLIIAIILMQTTAITFAQEFSQLIIGNHQQFERSYNVSSTPSSHIIATNVAEVINGSSRTSLRSIITDHNGVIQDVNRYITTDTTFNIQDLDVIGLSDGSYIISGIYSHVNAATVNKPFLMNISSGGAVNWSKVINISNGAKHGLKVLDDNSILLIYRSTNMNLICCKLEVNGTFTTIKELNNPQFSAVWQINPNKNGTVDIILSSGNILNINNDLSAINWQRKYLTEAGLICNQLTNGDYIFASIQVLNQQNITVYRTDSSGNVLWTKNFAATLNLPTGGQTDFHPLDFNFIEEDAMGNIIVSVQRLQAGSTLNLVLNANGDYVSNSSSDMPNNSAHVLDDNTYLIGSIEGFGPASFDFVFEKRQMASSYTCDTLYTITTTSGTPAVLTPDLDTLNSSTLSSVNIGMTSFSESLSQEIYCEGIVSSNNKIQQQEDITLNIYPNPTKDEIWIETEHPITKVILYNALGQQLVTSNERHLSLKHYANGLYIIELQKGTQRIIKKIIKE